MYLSKLEIIGFKSFAQKVNLTFDSGISAIVGPNGCGKTNIVDAIRWVLGEQRYSALRSEKMEDVIFNGTKGRKPLGMAEASLVIENTKGILPSEYSQVTIGRRVYRSGESEYLLNRVPCRLKDILDLFMDTGMGADAYSVIELKMVETILSDKTDERRRLFEEAAGVTKYKHRRKAAYRKLESVQADLVRVNDIVSEVQKAVNTLERQAKRAEQFNEVKGRLRSLEIDLMEREYAQLVSRTVPLEEKLAGLTEAKDRIDIDLSQEEARLDALRSVIGDVEHRLVEAQRDVSLHMEKIHKVEQKNLVAAERTRALQSNIVRYRKEKEDRQQEMQQLGSLEVEMHQKIGDLQAREVELARELELRQAELREFEIRLDAKKMELQQSNERNLELVHAIAQQQSEQDRKKARAENISGRAAHASEENAAYEAEIVHLTQQVADLSTEDKKLRRAFSEAEIQYYQAEADKKALQEQLDDLQRTILDVRTEIERRKAKVDFLKALIESREGLPEGVRFLTNTDQWKRTSASSPVTVADIIHADENYRAAIESALGEYAHVLVVQHEEEIEGAISLLKEQQKGKATFVCLDRLPHIDSLDKLPRSPGVHGWARDLAKYDSLYDVLFRFILDLVLIVEDGSAARKAARQYPGIRCVTVEGEMSSGAGITRGGSRRQDEGGMIGKHSQIAEFQQEIAMLAQRLEGLQSQRGELVNKQAEIQLKAFSDEVKSVEKDMNAVEMRIAQVEFEKKRAGDIIAKNNEEIAALESESAELVRIVEEEAPVLEALKAEKSDIERSLEAATGQLETLEKEWNERSKVVNELSIAIVALRGELQNVVNELKRARGSVADIIGQIEKREKDILSAEEAMAETAASGAQNAVELDELRGELEGIQQRKSGIEGELGTAREEMHSLELQIKDERRSHDDSLKATHELDLKIADLKAKCEHLKARAQEEFELLLELKTYPEDEFVDFAALRDQIQGLRDKIKNLGNINFAAFEEYTTEKERYEFLSSQRTDLLEAEKTLLSTIEEINSTAQKKFLDTFAQIRLNFIETFKSLFDPGDECDLKLEEDVDPLEARIEIVAKPRGKRPTSIDLLSGGEKTLTATALLFAIYLVKPSPFCILDEVDAPLDDANIDRFTRILKKFSDNTQFIVVTHNKRTMEAARAMYGVTMEEEGVSKLVTVRFNKSAEVQSAALASG